MSTLKSLLKDVPMELKMVGEYVDYLQPTNYLVSSKNYHDDYKTPVLTAGKTFILGYTDEPTGIFPAAKSPVIIFDDFTTANKWVDFDFKAKSSAMKILIPKDDSKIVLKYFYYWLNSCPSELADGDHKRQWISNFSLKLFPIPYPNDPEKTLAIQQEIVRVLDGLSEQNKALTTALAQEIDQRKKQYEYYREELFRFEGKAVEWKTLGDECAIGDGLHGTPKYDDKGDYYFVNGNNLSNGKIEIFEKTKKVNQNTFDKYGLKFDSNKTVFLSINGTIGSVAYYNNEKIVLGKSVAYFNIKTEEIKVQYLFYLFQSSISKDYFEKNKTGSTIKNLGLKSLRLFNIPVPSLQEQERIVRLLDQFDEATKNIVAQLEKEIELRNKQYEYYRNLLLSFPKV